MPVFVKNKRYSKGRGYIEHHPNEYLKNTMVFSALDNSATHHPLNLPA